MLFVCVCLCIYLCELFYVRQAEKQFELLTCELELTAADHKVRKKICRQLEALLQPTFSGLPLIFT